MSSFDRSPIGRKSSDQGQSPVLVPVAVCLITAAATVGTAFLSHYLDADGRTCADFGIRLDRIDDLTDIGVKTHRLNALVAGNPLGNCASYDLAVRERDELKAGVREGRSDWGTSQVEVPPRATPVPLQETLFPQVPAQPSEREAMATAPAQTTGMASAEPSPPASALPEPQMPALTVTPYEPVGPFEGNIGEKLTLVRSIEYKLKPPQFSTTTYSVSKGTVMVTVDGQPYLTCKPGNTFHLFWKISPDFSVVTYNKSAALTVLDQEGGKHLGTSDCLDPLG